MGAPGSGKTTLLNELKLAYHDDSGVIFVEEAARQFFEENPIPTEEREDYNVQRRIQDRVLRNEVDATRFKLPKALVTDRTAIDPAVYSFVVGDKVGAQRLMDRVAYWLPTYSHLFVLNVDDINHTTDGVRYEGNERRQRIHEAFLGFLALNEIEYQVLSGSLEERTVQVQELIP